MRQHCSVCHSALLELQEQYTYRKCSSCGTFFVDQTPNRQQIIKGLNRWADKITDERDDAQFPTKITYQRVNTLIRLNRIGKNLLDVGCGKADFLLAARNAEFHVSGMDIAEPIIRQLVRHKIPAYTSLKEIQNGMFDVVTCFDVIEHTTDPKRLTEEMHRVTKKDGILFLSTPNAASISAKLLGKSWWVFGPDGHYILFTPIGLRILLEKIGYSVISLETNTITQWIHTKISVVNKIGNKIIYCLLFPFLPFLYRSGLGDNIEVLARKVP